MSLTDIQGNDVCVGSLVRVLSLDPNDFRHLDEQALSEVMSMVGEVFEVYEIDKYGQAWVTKEWWSSESDVMSHSVGLSLGKMEVQSAYS
jgi:hypothetical protein